MCWGCAAQDEKELFVENNTLWMRAVFLLSRLRWFGVWWGDSLSYLSVTRLPRNTAAGE
jgi:hypothetical protein